MNSVPRRLEPFSKLDIHAMDLLVASELLELLPMLSTYFRNVALILIHWLDLKKLNTFAPKHGFHVRYLTVYMGCGFVSNPPVYVPVEQLTEVVAIVAKKIPNIRTLEVRGLRGHEAEGVEEAIVQTLRQVRMDWVHVETSHLLRDLVGGAGDVAQKFVATGCLDELRAGGNGDCTAHILSSPELEFFMSLQDCIQSLCHTPRHAAHPHAREQIQIHSSFPYKLWWMNSPHGTWHYLGSSSS